MEDWGKGRKIKQCLYKGMFQPMLQKTVSGEMSQKLFGQ